MLPMWNIRWKEYVSNSFTWALIQETICVKLLVLDLNMSDSKVWAVLTQWVFSICLTEHHNRKFKGYVLIVLIYKLIFTNTCSSTYEKFKDISHQYY